MINTVQYFRQTLKAKVRVTHYRAFQNSLDPLLTLKQIRNLKIQDKIAAKGGKTVIEMTTKDGQEFKAEAKCNPKDTFNRKLALQIALGRITKDMFGKPNFNKMN